MRILVLGASGGVGGWFTQLAALRGHDVSAITRPEAIFVAPRGVTHTRGDVTDAEFLGRIVPTHDVVVSCLGLRRAGLSPFARLLSPANLTERVTTLLVAAMRASQSRRLVMVSAGGVGESYAQLSWPVQRLVSTGNVRVAYSDLAKAEAVLETSGLEWLAVRPVTLTHGDPTGRAHVVSRYGLFSMIRRSDVATWMLNATEGPAAFASRRVLIAN